MSSSPKTYVFELRTDIRTIATLHRFLAKAGIHSPTRSALGDNCLEYLLEILLKNKLVEKFETSQYAFDYLKEFNLDKMKQRRGLKALAEQIDLEGHITSLAPASNAVMETLTAEELIAKAMESYHAE